MVKGYWLWVMGYGLWVRDLIVTTLEIYTHGGKDQLKRGGWFA